MFDKFEGNKIINFNQILTFVPQRYEVWHAGRKIDSGTTFTSFIDISSEDDKGTGVHPVRMYIGNNPTKSHLQDLNEFDAAWTSVDRVLCAIVPQESNLDDTSNNFAVFKSSSKFYTRASKNFEAIEPYASSIFFIDGEVKKVTFVCEAAEKLVVFYYD